MRYSTTVTFPSTSGKNVTFDDFFAFTFWYSAGSDFDSRTDTLGNQTGNWSTSQIMMTESTQAVPYSPKDFNTVLRECQRYYEKSYDLGAVPGSTDGNGRYSQRTFTTDAIRHGATVFYKVPKRTSTYTPVTYANDGTINELSIGGVSGFATGPANVGENSCFLFLNANTAAGGTGQSITFHWVADAEL